MKSQNRVRQNGSAKAAAQQATTPKGKPASPIQSPPSVPVVLEFFDGKLPFGGSVMAVKRRKGAVMDCANLWSATELVKENGVGKPEAIAAFVMKAVREKVMREGNVPPMKDGRPVEAAADVTSGAERDFENAMSVLLDVGDAAVTLLVLQADSIAWQTKDAVEFEKYNLPGFVEGCESLSRVVVKEFKRAFDVYHKEGLKLLNEVYGKRSLTGNPEFVRSWETVEPKNKNHDIWGELEFSVKALASCLRRQGELLCNGGDEGSLPLSQHAAKQIVAAFDACEKTYYPIARAANAFELLEAKAA